MKDSAIGFDEERGYWTFSYETELCDLPLFCLFTREPAWGEYPETYALHSVYVQGQTRPIALTGMLSDRMVDEIEQAFDAHKASSGL